VGLDKETVAFVLNEARKPHQIDISAFVDVILRANPRGLKEVLMENLTLEQVLEEAGLAARWEERKAINIAQNLIQEGLTREQIARTTGLDLPTVESLMGTAHA
jgi:hypothetical protein